MLLAVVSFPPVAMRSWRKNAELPTSWFHRTHYHWSITVNVYEASEGTERGRDRWGSRRVFEMGQRQTASTECCGTADLSSVCLLVFTATAVGSTLPLLTCASRQAHQTGTFIKPNSLRLIGPLPHLLSLTFAARGRGIQTCRHEHKPSAPTNQAAAGSSELQMGSWSSPFLLLWLGFHRGVCGDGNDVPYQFTCSHTGIPVCPGAGGMRACWASFVSS